MGRRSVASGGPVVVIAAVVTGVALLLGLRSGGPRPASRLAGSPVAVTSATSLTDRYSSSRPPPQLTAAQMRRQGELLSRECGVGAGGHRATGSPLPHATLRSTHQGRTAYLYLVGQNEIICTQDGMVGDSISGPQQQPAAPAAESMAIAGVTEGERHGRSATLEYGRLGTAVRRISFILAHGRRVPAAVGAGWFLVWWPTAQSPVSAELTTTSGRWRMALGAGAAVPATTCPRSAACYSTSSPGHDVVSGSISKGGGGFSGTIAPGGSAVMQRPASGPPPTQARVGSPPPKRIAVTLTNLGPA